MNEPDRNGSKRNREFGLDGLKIDAQSKLSNNHIDSLQNPSIYLILCFRMEAEFI